MDRETELRVIDEVADLLARGTTAMAPEPHRVELHELVDPARLRRERDVLFRRYPLVIGPSSRLGKPGDFVTTDIAGLPALVVRGEDQQIRAFVNVCRHRGNRLCQSEAGNSRVFACEYHAWTYSTEGRCRSFVDRAGFAGLDPADYNLMQLPAQERHGLVWVTPQPGGRCDVAEFLGPALDAELAGYRKHTSHVFTSITRAQEFNWKLGVNTFHELFHLAFLHKRTLGKAFVGNVSTQQAFGPHQRITVIRSDFPEMLTRPREEHTIFPHTAIIYSVFPNTVLVWQIDHVELWTFVPAVRRDDECVVRASLLVAEEPESDGARRHWQRNWDLADATVFGEDFAAMASIQANLNAGVPDHLVYGRNEPGLQHFHRQVSAAITEAP